MVKNNIHIESPKKVPEPEIVDDFLPQLFPPRYDEIFFEGVAWLDSLENDDFS